MGGLLRFLESPHVVAASAALVILAFAGVFFFFMRSGRARSARDQALRKERSTRKQFEAILSSTRDGVVMTSRTGNIVVLTATAANMIGVDKGAAIGMSLDVLPLKAVDENGVPVFVHEVFSPGKNDGSARVIGVQGRRGSEDVRWLHVTSRVVPDGFEGDSAVVTTLIDTTGLQEAAEALSRSDSLFRRGMENAPTGFALVDLEGRLMAVNRAFAATMGSTVAALNGTPFNMLSHPHDVHTEREQLQRLYDGSQSHFSLEKRYVRADGNVVWAVLDVGLVRHAGGAPDYYVVQVRDSTDDRLRSELMTHRAMHDPLTGLANRTLMHEVLQRALETPDATARVGVIAIDLDGFKGLNDKYGHAAGDTALAHVSGVLRSAAKGRGTVARTGGDEFVIVVQALDCSKALYEISAAIHEGLQQPLQLKRHELSLHCSVGIAMADDDTVAGGAPTLLSAADSAMYRAKALGKSRTEVYDPSMRATTEHGSVLTGELAIAIDRGDLVLHYQPIMELATRSVVGYEALVRWQHPTRGLLLPAAFIDLLDDRELASSLGVALVEQVAAFLAQSADPAAWVSLNVSADQWGDGEFVASVLNAIGRHRVSPRRFIVEVTEASLVNAKSRIRHELIELRDAGVPILLDDFGTGVAPLSYLRDLPVSGVKLDMSFVAGIPEDPAGARVSRALGALARELGLVTMAEGIETEAQADFLARCGWKYGQGWLFGVAQPAAAVVALGLPVTESLIEPRPQDFDSPFDVPPTRDIR